MRTFLKVNKQGNKYMVLSSSVQSEHEHFLSSIYGIYPIMPEGPQKLLICSCSENKCTFQGTLQLKCQASGIHVFKWVVLSSHSDLFLEKTVSEGSLLPPHPHSYFSMFYNAHKPKYLTCFPKVIILSHKEEKRKWICFIFPELTRDKRLIQAGKING